MLAIHPLGGPLQSVGECWVVRNSSWLEVSGVFFFSTSMSVAAIAHKQADQQKQDQAFWISRPLSSSRVPVTGQGLLCDSLGFNHIQVQGLRDVWEG